MIQRKHPLAHCEVCPLAKRDCAKTTGPTDATIAFVSRSPGRYDAEYRKPFAGPSGKVLDHLLNQNGVKRGEIITTNMVLCETDNPTVEALAACRPRLEAELAGCDTILAGGVEAVQALISPRASISAVRGRVHSRTTDTGRVQRVIATSNPAVVLRESSNFPDLVRDFRLALNPKPAPKLPGVWYTTKEQGALECIYDELIGKPRLASDLETFGYTSKIACAGFAYDTKMAFVFGLELFSKPKFLKALKELYESDIEWVWHNGKYDVKVLMRNGIKSRINQDTFILSYALDERPGGDYQGDQGAGLHALTPTLVEAYGWPDYEHNSVKQFKKDKEHTLHNPLELYDYNGKDTVGCLVLVDDFIAAAKADDVYDKPYKSILIPLANALIPVELRGFNYDVDAAADLNELYVRPKLKDLVVEMREITGRELYNPRSSQQNKGIFYVQYGIRHKLKDTYKNKKSESTDKDVRKEIMEGRSTCKPGKMEELLKYINALDVFSKIDKQRGTYIEGLIDKVQTDGKLYSTFKFGTVTGRTSSENPNFQNITRTGSNGLPSMRSLFIPSKGCKIVQADYSQAELRTIAKLSRDDRLLAIYRDSSRSLHKERAAAFYGKDYDKEQYTKAKNMNFGITYGQSAFTFSQMYQIPEDEAQGYIDSWWRDFPQIAIWVSHIQAQAQTDGVIVSPFGHQRRFHLITKDNLGGILREAVNFLPQNIAGVLTEFALVELEEKHGIPIVSTVHDSIVADVPESDVDWVCKTMKTVMERMAVEHLGWQMYDIPFLADISVGPNWGAVEEVTL